MRNISKMFLLGAGIILSLAGCQKGTTPANLTGKAIHFSAAAGSVDTRTAFSGDGTQDGSKTDEFGRKLLTWERIDWAIGDAVLIASDKATIYQDPDTHYATYTVASVTASEDKKISEAELDEKDGSEELFFTGADSYTFWGIYPAAAGNGTDLLDDKASFTISNAQPVTTATATTTEVTKDGVTKKLTTLAGGMTQGVMLAKAENQTAESVKLQFYPAFTAFEFTLNSKGGDLLLKELVLTPAAANTSLAGDVVASIKTGGTSTFVNTYPSDTDPDIDAAKKKLTYTFPANTTITTTDYLTFTVFALPETINGLILEFHMGENGDIVQKAELKKSGAAITFEPCKKYNLRGIAVRGGWTFELDGEVLEWEYLEKTTEFGEQLQTTAFEDHNATPPRVIIGAAENGENNYASFDPINKNYTPMPYAQFNALSTEEQAAYQSEHGTYQYRYYQNRTLLPNAEYFEFAFTPQAPRGGYWLFEPEGDVTMFRAEMRDVDTITWDPVDIGNIQGQIMNKMVYIRLYPSSLVPSTRTQPYSIYFKVYFSANIDFEPALSADSEIQDVHGKGDFSYWHFVIPANN